eukprot:GHVS01095051.1.p1 GENE.GHVS01095051.1~~GHVS01095051.1.p1  ORF type:complete len:353 (+),score=46.02 GHVS01095051.1:214-1272(+)
MMRNMCLLSWCWCLSSVVCFLLSSCSAYPVVDVEFDQEMLSESEGTMRAFAPGLSVLKGYVLSFGHVFPSLPYYSYPWSTSDINTFLQDYYTALDAGSTAVIEDRFAKDALMLLDVRLSDGTVVDTVTKGKAKIVANTKRFIQSRGAVTSPTIWNVLTYRHPLVIVEGQVTFANKGSMLFVHSFAFRGDKVGLTGIIVSEGTSGVAVVPVALSNLLESVYSDLDNKKTAVAESNFPDGYTSILFHRYPKDNSTFHLFSKDLKGFVRLSNIYFASRGAEPTNTTYTVVKYLYPKIWVEVTVEQPAGSGNVLSTLLVGYKVEESNGEFQLLGDLSVLDFPDTTAMEFFLSLNKQ